MPHLVKRLAIGVPAVALLVLAAACGTEEQAVETTTTTVTENPSAPVVAGPSPRPNTQVPAQADDDDRECGTTSGPDGALRVLVTDGDVTCDEAMAVAARYGPLIATGQDQMVDGWDCGPSDDDGVLAQCERDNDDAIDDDDDEIDFAP
ncbi:hypothetical protein V1Y59_12220 [Gordonia sp. PKS22-38]|uniref:Secreted protein n=1 Tax=Gordonia prachuapensis TaxID=3115651 RepID=A0ABU7MU33_9ACTN|nr:hypothetical protein [Gordonia sp. PKS22-38]